MKNLYSNLFRRLLGFAVTLTLFLGLLVFPYHDDAGLTQRGWPLPYSSMVDTRQACIGFVDEQAGPGTCGVHQFPVDRMAIILDLAVFAASFSVIGLLLRRSTTLGATK